MRYTGLKLKMRNFLMLLTNFLPYGGGGNNIHDGSFLFTLVALVVSAPVLLSISVGPMHYSCVILTRDTAATTTVYS